MFITNNPTTFLKLSLTYQEKFLKRVEQLHAYLSEEHISSFLNNQTFAICLRGSYARGHPNQFSDIDFFVLYRSPNIDRDLIKSLLKRYTPNHPTHFIINSLDKAIDTYSFPLLVSFPHLRFLAGNQSIYQEFISKFKYWLKNTSFDNLHRFFLGNPHRSDEYDDPKSPHYWDFKSGAGGLVDYEFLVLCDWWLKEHKIIDSLQVSTLPIQQATAYYFYFCCMKEYVQNYYQMPLQSSLPIHMKENILLFESTKGNHPNCFSADCAIRVKIKFSTQIVLIEKNHISLPRRALSC